MRLPIVALFVLAGCSSSEVTTTITSSSGSAPKPAASTAKSAAAPASASAAAPVASASAAMRDAETELKAIDPFNETATDGAQRLLTAMTLCGQPASNAPWGRDDSVGEDKAAPTPPKPAASRCTAESHAKLYMKSVSMLADSKDAAGKKTAEDHAYLALALDPKVALPASAKPGETATLAAARKRRQLGARVGAVTSNDDATTKALEPSIASEILPAVRFCYASALLTNVNLQGSVAISAEVAADGRLSGAKVDGSLPDSAVIACIQGFANRSKLAAPLKTPARVNIPIALSPGG